MNSGIYRIQIGENFYFGSAVNLKNREWSHRSDLRGGKHPNRWMQNAWNKHLQMQFEVIELCAAESLIEREQAHISEWFDHPRCMNLSPTAGSTLGVKHTDEARRNMSEAHQGCWKEKRHPMLGKPRSKETREKLRAANLGKRFSDERKALHKAAFAHPGVRMKMALSRMGRTQSAETIEKRMKNCRGGDNYRARRCRLIFLDGSDLIFPCVSDAAKHVNISHVTLVNWLLGKKPWPGDGAFLRGKTKNLIGLKGEYLP